jgi:Flp pilus assembly protein TadG
MGNFEKVKSKAAQAMGNHRSTILLNEKGVVLVYVAILLVVFLGIAALAVDVGYVMVSKNELQTAADAAALAGARQLGENYKDNLSPLSTNVIGVAQDTASLNQATKQNLLAGNVVASLGIWNPIEIQNNVPFPSGATYPNAVKASVKRNPGTPSGAVGTFFAQIFKLIDPSSSDTVNVEATACATITGPCEEKPTIPLGIGKGWFDIHPGDGAACGPIIRLNDTTDSCAGWTNLSTQKFKQAQVSDMLTGKTPMPSVGAGSIVEFGGGTVTGLLEDLEALFLKMKDSDGDGDPAGWTTSVVVYDESCGQNPNKPYEILGFARLKITKVTPTTGNKGIEAKVVCGIGVEEPGGCEAFGTYSVYPRLVQ